MSLFPPIPSVVSEQSSEALEWDRLKELVASYAGSNPGREWLRALSPSTELPWILGQHELVGEMRLLLKEGALPPLGGLFDPEALVQRARIEGASLAPEEIRDLLGLLDSIAAWQALRPETTAGPLAKLAERLPREGQAGNLARSLRAKLNPDGTLTDDASPALRRIRKEIDRQQRAVEESLRKTMRRLSEGGEAQEDLITIRGERFVIPVKAEFKRRIPGVVHGASSSGQTVYLEPLETIEQNNELVRLMDEEQTETGRIFRELTGQIGAQADAIVLGAAALAVLDTLLARARFAEAFDCVSPRFSGFGFSSSASAEPSSGPIEDPLTPQLTLKQARHPLLENRLRSGSAQAWKAAPAQGEESLVAQAGSGAQPKIPARLAAVVPLTLTLTSEERQVIISGPNTGGKTVVLKTAGLLALMAQSGIPVPAREAVFPLFNRFLADIGDAQSMEQNLSTFSAHIVNLDRIARIVDTRSLVLLDELGSSTDPEEGAALAVALAGFFLRRQAWCLISTHHTALKVYAAENPGVLNAAMGFEERTLEPTYELRLGIAGASAGINIARRLGLDPAIVNDALAKLNTQTKDISHFLDQLHSQLAAAAAERAALRSAEQRLAREKDRLDKEGLNEWRAKVRDLEQQLQTLLKDFTYRMRESVAAVADRAAQQKLSKEAERRIARLRREFSEQFDATVVAHHSGADKGDANAQPHLVRQVAVGDTVRLKSLGKSGRVLRQLEGDAFEVAVGAMKMRVPRADIAEVLEAPQPSRANPVEAARRRGISVTLSQPDAMSSEINVIGRTVDEATGEVDQFLDRAFLAGLPRVRIVHGTGMGVLRRALRSQLERHPHVAQIAEASQSEGGAGATVVELRQ